jgi:hypothetical protein
MGSGDLAGVDWISNGLEEDDGDVELVLLVLIAGGGLAGDGTGHGCCRCCSSGVLGWLESFG